MRNITADEAAALAPGASDDPRPYARARAAGDADVRRVAGVMVAAPATRRRCVPVDGGGGHMSGATVADVRAPERRW